jgi:uncharacterized membrane protein
MKLIIPLTALALSYLLFFEYLNISYQSLPDKVASHFGIDGQPNGWMPRDVLVEFMAGIGFFLPLIIIIVMGSIGWMPVKLVNLPNRDYWLGPAQRKATADWFLRHGIWFATLNVLFITGTHWLVVQANTGDAQLKPMNLLLVIGSYLAGICLWLALLLRRFTQKR